jgi:acyl-CoA synthetase (NDP forming)
MELMDRFFKPRSVAVIGASGTPGKLGYVIVKNIADSDFSGSVYPVNPKSDEILGYKVFRSVTEIPGDVDLVVTALPTPKVTLGAVEECAKKGVKAIIIESAGFGEMGGEGKVIQDQIVDIAKKNNIRVMGPNCSGIVSRNIVTSIYPIIKKVPRGNVVLIGQSGILAAGMAADLVGNESLNINKVCSIGNKCDVNENDLLEYFGNEDDVDVISMYLETVTDGRNLTRIAKKVTPKKPIIFLSGGRTEAGASAANSHTGSISPRSFPPSRFPEAIALRWSLWLEAWVLMSLICVRTMDWNSPSLLRKRLRKWKTSSTRRSEIPLTCIIP